jgi:hypothetical protein
MVNGKLGKKPAVEDVRTFKLSKLLDPSLPTPPVEYNFDAINKTIIPTPMFANDKYGDCVMAGRAHMTLRFEYFEQKLCLDINDGEILYQYWKEGGWPGCWFVPKPDNGLVMLLSLKSWQNLGWKLAGNKYNIYAYASIHWSDFDEVKCAISLLNGAYCGLALPNSAQNQDVWDVSDSSNGAKASWGYHCVAIPEYNKTGPVCVTWGAKKQMTWAFLNKYCDECYAIIDDKNKFTKNSPIDIEKLQSYLNALKS